MLERWVCRASRPGQSANAHSSSLTGSPRGMPGPPARGESLASTYSSACASFLSVETAGKDLNAAPPDSGKRSWLAAVEVAIREFGEDAFGYRLAVLQRDREVNRQAVVAGRDVRAPADPGQHVTAFHQEAVAEITRRHRVVHVGVRSSVVHATEGNLAAAVVDFEEQRRRTFRHVHRLEDHHIGRKLDRASAVERREADVEHRAVALDGGVGLEPGAAGELLVGAGAAEGHAVRDDFALADLQPREPCFRGRVEGKTGGECQHKERAVVRHKLL